MAATAIGPNQPMNSASGVVRMYAKEGPQQQHRRAAQQQDSDHKQRPPQPRSNQPC